MFTLVVEHLEAIDNELYSPSRDQRIEENETRIGFEIESGWKFKIPIDKMFLHTINSVTNKTLGRKYISLNSTKPQSMGSASTQDVVGIEFLIDDINDKKGTAQLEFRTLPLSTRHIDKELRREIIEAIQKFPLSSFNQNRKGINFHKDLEEQDWELTDNFYLVSRLLTTNMEKLTWSNPRIQHVTHSLPLAGFLKLSGQERDFIIPGAAQVSTIENLIRFFYGRIVATVDKSTGIIDITTTSRNKTTPNIKTPLDALIGMLEPELAMKIIREISQDMPRIVKSQDGSSGKIADLKVHHKIPKFSGFNTEDGRAYLSGEEKPRVPLFDVTKKDLRVLVEHRGKEGGLVPSRTQGKDLVTSLNEALIGNHQALSEWITIFNKLDIEVGDPLFNRWFQ